jgi:hypothetical protein
MTFGLNVLNDFGAVIMDTNYPQMPLIASGSGAATGPNNYDTEAIINYGTTVNNPVLFIRPDSINNIIRVGTITSTQFAYRCSGTISWRVYEASGSGFTSSGQGMSVFDSSGTLLYNTQKYPPFIRQIQIGLDGTEPISFTSRKVIRTLSTNVTAYDGGLPFINAAFTQVAAITAGPSIFLAYDAGIQYTSATQVEVWQIPYFSAGTNIFGASTGFSGQIPRSLIFIR